jgi:hypothetical protein
VQIMPVLAVTEWGCRLGGGAQIVAFGFVWAAAPAIADSVFGPRRASLITRREVPDPEELTSRTSYAQVARWTLRVWAGLGIAGGASVLSGLLHCG